MQPRGEERGSTWFRFGCLARVAPRYVQGDDDQEWVNSHITTSWTKRKEEIESKKRKKEGKVNIASSNQSLGHHQDEQHIPITVETRHFLEFGPVRVGCFLWREVVSGNCQRGILFRLISNFLNWMMERLQPSLDSKLVRCRMYRYVQ